MFASLGRAIRLPLRMLIHGISIDHYRLRLPKTSYRSPTNELRVDALDNSPVEGEVEPPCRCREAGGKLELELI